MLSSKDTSRGVKAAPFSSTLQSYEWQLNFTTLIKTHCDVILYSVDYSQSLNAI
jgi:hypothetical protein